MCDELDKLHRAVMEHVENCSICIQEQEAFDEMQARADDQAYECELDERYDEAEREAQIHDQNQEDYDVGDMENEIEV